MLCVGLAGRRPWPDAAQVPHRRSLRAHITRVHSMSWTNARPTGGSYVRGSPAVGFLASEKNTPLSAVLPGLEVMHPFCLHPVFSPTLVSFPCNFSHPVPPTLAPLRNPICPWDASNRWHRAFSRDSLTMRSNRAQLETLGFSDEVAPTVDDSVLVPAVTGGKLRYLLRPRAEAQQQLGQTSFLRPVDYGLTSSSLGSSCALRPMGTPDYLASTPRLPVMQSPEDRPTRSPSPYGDGEASPTSLIRPAHLKINGEYTSRTFQPRRFGHPQVWRSSTQEQWAQVHGARAFH